MITRNIVGGIATTIIGAVYLYLALHIRVSALADGFGPRGMPVIYGWLVTGLGLLLLVHSAIEVARLSPEARAVLSEKEWAGQGRKILQAAGLFAIAIAFLFAVNILGYPLTLALLIAAVAVYMGARPDLLLLVIAAGGAAMMWFIFVGLLDVRMPQGIFSSLGF
ncbi:hypothetical protein ATN84_21945 [Paramesorhizobium deserti]|uniref:DUF1468 domain-containing protein n=1 Tax=Paramesorhizobium deserti TaxID=1494590 RepID=A0A135HP21_9HYPH|nr:tripartite tricarboxylate transporter TctB family protein [Paramesorhizobium deserti]KXF74886.1 hypothetical protein ATN84_21945 [Paramesorhizobium deserti]